MTRICLAMQKNNIVSFSACDTDKTVLDGTLNARLKPNHLYPSIQKCLPNAVRIELERLRPTESSHGRKRKMTTTDIESHQSSYGAMDEMLATKADQLHGPKLRSSCCCFHPRGDCPLFWPVDDRVHEGSRYRPIRSFDSSTMCVPWTSAGAHLGWADPTTESWTVFTHLAAQSDLDEVNLETSSNMPAEAFVQAI